MASRQYCVHVFKEMVDTCREKRKTALVKQKQKHWHSTFSSPSTLVYFHQVWDHNNSVPSRMCLMLTINSMSFLCLNKIICYFKLMHWSVISNHAYPGYSEEFWLFLEQISARSPTKAKRFEANIATKTSEKTQISKTSIIWPQTTGTNPALLLPPLHFQV